MSLVGQIITAYRRPSAAFDAQLVSPVAEPQTLFYGMLFGVINLIAAFPGMVITLQDQDAVTAQMAQSFVSYVFFLPLMLYILAGVLHWVFLRFNGRGQYDEMRRVLNWACVVTIPFVLLSGIVFVFQNSALVASFQAITGIVFIWQLWIGIQNCEYNTLQIEESL